MSSVSVKQRRFFAIAEHHPDALKGRMPKMSKGEMHKFASTSEKGLPMKVKIPKRKVKYGK